MYYQHAVINSNAVNRIVHRTALDNYLSINTRKAENVKILSYISTCVQLLGYAHGIAVISPDM